jgi:hypothetical protein
MNPIVDFFIVWHVAALLVVAVLAIVSFQWTRGRLAALLLVGTVAVLLQLMTVMPLMLAGDAKPAVVAEKTEWTTDMRQGWSLR